MNEWLYAVTVLTLMATLCIVFSLAVRVFIAGLCTLVEMAQKITHRK